MIDGGGVVLTVVKVSYTLSCRLRATPCPVLQQWPHPLHAHPHPLHCRSNKVTPPPAMVSMATAVPMPQQRRSCCTHRGGRPSRSDLCPEKCPAQDQVHCWPQTLSPAPRAKSNSVLSFDVSGSVSDRDVEATHCIPLHVLKAIIAQP